MNVAIYARYSTDNQRSESIDDQIDSCKRFAAQKDWVIHSRHIYADEAISGTKRRRPGLNAMQEAAEGKEFSVVLVDDLSRLARDNHLMLTLIATLQYWDVRVISVADGLDSIDENAQLGIQFKGIVNELQVKETSKRTFRGMRGQKERGFSAGERVFGYVSIPVGEIKIDKNGNRRPDGYKLEINPEEARVVLRVFEEFAAGKSLIGIVRTLNEEKISGFKRLPGKWSVATVGRMLDNEKYIGVWAWNKTGTRRDPLTGKTRTVPKPKEDWITSKNETLRVVSEDLWQVVKKKRQRMREIWAAKGGHGFAKGQGAQRDMYPTHLLSGLLHCHVCGGAMSQVSGKKGGYYGCLAATKRACSNRKLVKRSIVEDRIIGALVAQLATADNYRFLLDEINKEIAKVQKEAPKHIAEKKHELLQLERKLKNFVDFVSEGKGSRTLAAAIDQTEEKVDEVSRDIEELEGSMVGDQPLPTEEWINARLRDFKGILEERTTESALLLRDVMGKIVLKYRQEDDPDSGYVAHAKLDPEAVLAVPLAAENSGSNPFHRRPQGEVTIASVKPLVFRLIIPSFPHVLLSDN